MRLAASGTPVAVNRRAVEPVNKVKIFPVFSDWVTGAEVMSVLMYAYCNAQKKRSVMQTNSASFPVP
jgi:hypothetical protein